MLMNDRPWDPRAGDAIESALGRTHGNVDTAVVSDMFTNDSRSVMSLLGEPIVGVE